MNFSKFIVASLAVGLFFYQQTATADTLIDNFTDAGNDRFTNDALLVLPANFSLSGVGRSTNNGRWATLIGDNVFLTANHFRPALNSTIEFYPGNDPSASPFTANVVGGSRVVTPGNGSDAGGTTDLYVGYLDQAVDSSIARYDFATEFINGVAADPGFVNISPNNPFQGDLGYIVGISPTNRSAITTDQSVGLNLVSGYAENVDFLGNTNNDTLIYEFNDPNDGNAYVDNEAYVRGGDSGAPNFTVQNGELLLLGVNSFQLNGDPVDVVLPTGETSTEQFRATGITYTGNQADEINRLIAAAPTFTAVPEPSSTTILAMLSLLILRRNRK